jgi:hypothetical protein
MNTLVAISGVGGCWVSVWGLQLRFLLVRLDNTCNLYIANGQWHLVRELNVFEGLLRDLLLNNVNILSSLVLVVVPRPSAVGVPHK